MNTKFSHIAIEVNNINRCTLVLKALLGFELTEIRESKYKPGPGWNIAFLSSSILTIELIARKEQGVENRKTNLKNDHIAFMVDSIEPYHQIAIDLGIPIISSVYAESGFLHQVYYLIDDSILIELFT